jgi:hypothetical protein
MNMPAKFQLNRTTNAYQSELLIKTGQHFQNAIFSLCRPCPDMTLGCPDKNSTKHILLLKAMSGHPINMSEHPVPVIVLNDFKLCPRSRDCEAIINTSL